jgi:carbamoyltransferase
VQYGIESPLLSDDSLIETVATAIADGKIVGWYQGRMEFGARALGARSLLADPRNPDIRNVINLKIKHREIFRPFAPSILEEDVDLFFERAEPVPFMEKVLRVRESQRHKIPAVTHVDGTGRLQTVTERESPLYWRLIRAFKAKTGVPVILNTSLNENEPIVNSPKQALDCFMRTKMDAIALGSFWITREMIRQH